MLVKITAPKGVVAVRYGRIQIQMGADGTALTTGFIAKHLTAMGFQAEPDVSKLDPASDMTADEATRLIEAYSADKRNAIEEIKEQALIAAARKLLAPGAPVPTITLGRSPG